MSAAILGTRPSSAFGGLGRLGQLGRDARRKEKDKLRGRTPNMLGGGGLQASPARRPAPLGGLGQ